MENGRRKRGMKRENFNLYHKTYSYYVNLQNCSLLYLNKNEKVALNFTIYKLTLNNE